MGKATEIFQPKTRFYADAEAAWTYLVEQKKIKPGDIYIYGHSLGGAVAINFSNIAP